MATLTATSPIAFLLLLLLLPFVCRLTKVAAGGSVADRVQQFGNQPEANTAGNAAVVTKFRVGYEKQNAAGGGTGHVPGASPGGIQHKIAAFSVPRSSVALQAKSWQATANAQPLQPQRRWEAKQMDNGTPVKHSKWGEGKGGKGGAEGGTPAAKRMWEPRANAAAAVPSKPREQQPQVQQVSGADQQLQHRHSLDCSQFTQGRERCDKWMQIFEELRHGNRLELFANCKKNPLGLGILKSQLFQVMQAIESQYKYEQDASMLAAPPLTRDECHVRDEGTWMGMLASVKEQLTVLPVAADKIPVAYIDPTTGEQMTYAALDALVQVAVNSIQKDEQPPRLPIRKQTHELELARKKWLQLYQTLDDFGAAIRGGKFVAIKYFYAGEQANLGALLELAKNTKERVIDKGKPVLVEPPVSASFKDRIAQWKKIESPARR